MYIDVVLILNEKEVFYKIIMTKSMKNWVSFPKKKAFKQAVYWLTDV